jgi:DNA-binding transcriptional MerR regulator
MKEEYQFQELTELTGIKPYVLRFWETEFIDIKPRKNQKGEKIYSRHDLETLLTIKRLLFEDKMTIAQAKHKIEITSSEIEKVEEEVVEINYREILQDCLGEISKFKSKYQWL